MEKTEFNTRLQPAFIKLGTTSNPMSVLQLGYEYTSTCQSANNGNVLKQTITAPGLSLTQNYCYDALNRLSSANENNGSSWTQTYDYDRYGNRAVRAGSYMPIPRQTPASSSPSDLPVLFNQANNRIIATSEYGYDAAGNLTSMPDKLQGQPSDTMTYDAENRQKTFNGTVGQYFYDGDGHRVKKTDSTGTTVFVYNAGGQLIAEYHSDPAPPASGGGGTSYLTSDHLGSTRVVTKSDGTVKARYDYLPFAEELPSTVGSRSSGVGYSAADSTKRKFTQKERDSESGLDYFLARYYSSAQGRFTSVDPENAGTEHDEPQTWNAYAYTSNNPLNRTDADGRRWFTKDGETPKWVDANEDGSYTSPGDGWKEWIPKSQDDRLIVYSQDGYRAMVLGEYSDGRPLASHWLWTGKTETKPEHIIAAVAIIRLSIEAGTELLNFARERAAQKALEDVKIALETAKAASQKGLTERLLKKADDLILGRLKRSLSYHSELGQDTHGTILQKARGGDQKAKDMKKLIESAQRLSEKTKGKPK